LSATQLEVEPIEGPNRLYFLSDQPATTLKMHNIIAQIFMMSAHY